MEGWGGTTDYTPDFGRDTAPPAFEPVHRLEGWISPAHLYEAIQELAQQNPDAKHVCWDMLMLAHALPRTLPQGIGQTAARKHKEAGK